MQESIVSNVNTVEKIIEMVKVVNCGGNTIKVCNDDKTFWNESNGMSCLGFYIWLVSNGLILTERNRLQQGQ